VTWLMTRAVAAVNGPSSGERRSLSYLTMLSSGQELGVCSVLAEDVHITLLRLPMSTRCGGEADGLSMVGNPHRWTFIVSESTGLRIASVAAYR
jgi:hypothetical protein